jgi:uncharacterized protein (DUF1330 family)
VVATWFLAEIQRITDRAAYKRYVDAARPLVEQHGGSYVLRSDRVSAVSGESSPERVVLTRFPDRQSLAACFSSQAYAEIAPLRERSTESRALVIEDG